MRSLPMLILLTAMFAICSCKSEKDRIAEIVEYWQGRKIVFPEIMTDFLTGDTIDLTDADFTILTYIDGSGCSDCKLKFQYWKEFLNSLDSVSDRNVLFVMIVDDEVQQELKYLIKKHSFNYPLYVDEYHRMSAKYGFSHNTALQTFLLDNKKRVLTIGNPVVSLEINKLYKSIILGKISFSSESNDIISTETNKIKLGNIAPGEQVIRSVVLINHSQDTVAIRKIISSCECVNLIFPNNKLTPSKEEVGTLIFSGDSIFGEFERSVSIYYKGYDYPTVIRLLGNIE